MPSQYKCAPLPQRKIAESDEEYKKQLEVFWKNDDPDPKKNDPAQSKPPFYLPKDKQEFLDYVKQNPDTKWHINFSASATDDILKDIKNLNLNVVSMTMNCKDRDEMRDGMRALKDNDLLKTLNKVHRSDQKQDLSGNALNKEIEKLFPHLKGPRPPE